MARDQKREVFCKIMKRQDSPGEKKKPQAKKTHRKKIASAERGREGVVTMFQALSSKRKKTSMPGRKICCNEKTAKNESEKKKNSF